MAEITTMMMKTLFFPDAEEEPIRADFSHSREVSAVADLAAVPEEDSEAVALADSAAAEVLAAVVLQEDGKFE